MIKTCSFNAKAQPRFAFAEQVVTCFCVTARFNAAKCTVRSGYHRIAAKACF